MYRLKLNDRKRLNIHERIVKKTIINVTGNSWKVLLTTTSPNYRKGLINLYVHYTVPAV